MLVSIVGSAFSGVNSGVAVSAIAGTPTTSFFAKNFAGTVLTFLLFLIIFFIFFLISTEKAPFDVVEAESELIDGVTTEFEGYAFSLQYAGEVALSLVMLKIFSTVIGFVVVFPLIATILGVFVGRIFLARFLVVDVVEIAVSSGLFASLTILAIKNFSG